MEEPGGKSIFIPNGAPDDFVEKYMKGRGRTDDKLEKKSEKADKSKKVKYSLKRQSEEEFLASPIGQAFETWFEKQDEWTIEQSCKHFQKADKKTWRNTTTVFRGIGMEGSYLKVDDSERYPNQSSFEHMFKTGTMEMIHFKGEPVAVSAEQRTASDYGDVIMAMPKDDLDLAMPFDRQYKTENLKKDSWNELMQQGQFAERRLLASQKIPDGTVFILVKDSNQAKNEKILRKLMKKHNRHYEIVKMV